MKKFIATGAAIAFAATLTSCEIEKKEENKQIEETPELNQEINNESAEAEADLTKEVQEAQEIKEENPMMKLFQDKQAEMSKLFQEFEKNTPEFKPLQEEINAIFTSGKEIGEEEMKRVQEIDSQIRELFTPEMRSLDEELRKMSSELFSQQEPQQVENNELNNVNQNENIQTEETSTGTEAEKPMMILK